MRYCAGLDIKKIMNEVTVMLLMKMPFGKLNYNGDVIVLNDVMHVHNQHLSQVCHVTAYCQPVKNIVLA